MDPYSTIPFHMLRRRHYGPYPLATPSATMSIIRSLIILVLLSGALVVVGMKVLSWFGVGNSVRQNAVMLTVDGPGSVGVSIAGQEPKRTESSMKVYPGDRLETSDGARATLEFFDGTFLRLETDTAAEILESERGEAQSQWSIHLGKGSLWIQTPTIQSFSGSIRRDIETSAMLLTIPSQTEAVTMQSALTVFSADGLGISTLLAGRDMPIFIGEGQELVLPAGLVEGDPYRFRSPLDPLLMRPFVEESRKRLITRPAVAGSGSGKALESSPLAENGEVLTVNEPKEGETVSTSIVRVSGTIAGTVDRLRINGYLVPFDPVTLAFSREISLPDEDEVILLIEALAADGTVQAKVQRNVRRNRTPPAAPTIVSPAKNGELYTTDREAIEISGIAPEGTVGIIVNDYRLQLFKPGDAQWSYLANAKLGNMQQGPNTYSAVAINAGGYKSPAAKIQIIYGEGRGEGVVAQAGTGSSIPPPPAEEVLPENAPLAPGSLSVTGPTPGKSHTATGSAMLIEGMTSPETASMWVNGYRLQLYKSGKTMWNYIADAHLQTLRRGTNVYHILARDSKGQILDTMDYTIVWRPGKAEVTR